MASRTVGGRHVIHEPVAVVFRRGLVQRIFQIAENSQKSCLPPPFRLSQKKQVLDLLRKLFKRGREVDSIGRGYDLDLMNQVLGRRTRPQSTFEQGFRPVVDYLRGIKVELAPQAMAFRTSPVGAVEGKRARLKLG